MVERIVRPWSIPGNFRSSTYNARPVTLSSPSLRGTFLPTARIKREVRSSGRSEDSSDLHRFGERELDDLSGRDVRNQYARRGAFLPEDLRRAAAEVDEVGGAG